jgi:two-component system cell cycle sensor histidine kinase/response regulator CckA
MLRLLGYPVLEATNGAEALELASAQQGAIDLLVADVVMPRLGGPSLADELRRQRPELKVLLISGYAAEALAELSNPSVSFMTKPYTPSQLARRVREILGAEARSVGVAEET